MAEPLTAGRPARGGWQRIAGIAFVGVAFLFLGYFFGRNTGALRAHDWTVRPGLLAVSIGVNLVGLVWGVGVWRLLLRRLGTDVRLVPLARVWFLSGLGRYIPGKIWQFFGAAHLGASIGMPATLTVTSLAAHTGFFLVGALLTSIYLLPAPVSELGGVAVDLLRWVAPLALLLVHPALIRTAVAAVRRLTGRTLGDWTGGWLDGVGIVALSTVGWALTGLALYLFVASLTPLPTSVAPAFIGINALSFVVGYLVFFAPAGLGAKEGALAALLAFYAPAPVAVLLAVAARLWMIVAEVLPALVLLLLDRPRSLRTAHPRAPVPPDR